MLLKKKQQILDSWMNHQLEEATLREDLISNDELRSQSEELLTSFLEAISKGNLETNAVELESMKEILSDISTLRARQGFSPRETGAYILSLKKAMVNTLQEENKDDFEKLYKENLLINDLIDSLSMVTFETYIKGREEVISRQSDEMSEISTPVIRVWEGVVALPIIGTLDSARTQIVMENLLQEIVSTGSSIAILDISGVPAVDSLVAQHLMKTVSATRLMGAECIISGIRAEIAQTIVHLGIDLSNIKTKSTLASALQLAFNMLKLEVKRSDKGALKS